MIVEINDTLVNIDNVCTSKRCYQTDDDTDKLIPSLLITFVGGKSEFISFKSVEDMNVGYQTLRLFETVTNKIRKK